MADPKDVSATKMLRREFNKHRIDLTHADIRVTHGVGYIRGTVGLDRGGDGVPGDLRTIVEKIGGHLRQKGIIHDYIVDCRFRL